MMRSQLFHARVIILFTISVMSAGAVFGEGWNDFSFDLPGGYFVRRASSADIHIWRKGVGTALQEVQGQQDLGPLYELAFDDRFIFTKNRACHKHGDSLQVPVFWTIIDYTQHVVYGPLSEADFQNTVASLGISLPVQWESLEDAYKKAVQGGRADKKQFDLELILGIMNLGVGCVLMMPVLLLGSVLAGLQSCRAKMFRRFCRHLE